MNTPLKENTWNTFHKCLERSRQDEESKIRSHLPHEAMQVQSRPGEIVKS